MSEERTVAGPFGRVAVFDSKGDGPAVILLHGNSASSRAYARQLDGPLGRKLRLVAFDFMGHGKSADSSAEGAYWLSGHARTLAHVAGELGLENAVFAGWSLGGHVVLEAAPMLSKARGFLIAGTPPIGFPPDLGGAFLPNPAFNLSLTPNLSREDAQAYANAGFSPGYKDVPEFYVEDILRTDSRARQGVAESIDPSRSRDELHVVASLTAPLAVIHGEQDQLVNGGYFVGMKAPTLWCGAVQVIAGAGHTPHWEKPDAFDAALADFVRDCG